MFRDVLDEKDYLNFFTEKNEEGGTVLSCAFRNKRLEVLNFYLQSKLIPSLLDHFADDSERKVKLIRLLRNEDISEFQNELEKIKEDRGLEYLQHLLKSWTIEGRTFIEILELASKSSWRKRFQNFPHDSK